MASVTQDDAVTGALQRRIAELEAAGRYAEAIPLAERYVEAAKAQFGDDHPSYAAALNSLGRALYGANRAAEAEPILRCAASILEEALGATHPSVGIVLINLGELLIHASRPAEAEPLMRRVNVMLEEALGKEETGFPTDHLTLNQLLNEKRLAETVPLLRAWLPVATARASGIVLASFAGERSAPDRSADALAERAAEERAKSPSGPAPQQSPAPQAPDGDRLAEVRRRAEARATSALPERTDLPKPRQKVDAKRALEIDAGRLAYQIPKRMWLDIQETVEVRLGRTQAQGLTQGFAGRGDVRTEDIPIVETMSVSLACEPGAFDIVPRSEKDQLVKPDLVLGTPFHSDDFGRWVWLVTPRQRGEHTLLVKVAAAIRDSRGLPATSSLPDKTFAVSVRVQLFRAAAGALLRAAPGLAWAVVTALVGVFTKDYWWPAIRHMIGLG
jgi:hypothetical protein